MFKKRLPHSSGDPGGVRGAVQTHRCVAGHTHPGRDRECAGSLGTAEGYSRHSRPEPSRKDADGSQLALSWQERHLLLLSGQFRFSRIPSVTVSLWGAGREDVCVSHPQLLLWHLKESDPTQVPHPAYRVAV